MQRRCEKLQVHKKLPYSYGTVWLDRLTYYVHGRDANSVSHADCRTLRCVRSFAVLHLSVYQLS